MATTTLSRPTALATFALLFALAAAAAAAATNPSNYDISKEQGWDSFVKAASQGTGGTPSNMGDFVKRVNGNINDGEAEDLDPELSKDLQSFDHQKGSRSAQQHPAASQNPEPPASDDNAVMDDASVAQMIALKNGGALAPEDAPINKAFSINAAVVVIIGGMMPAFAACFVL